MRRVAQNDPTKSARKGPRDLTTGPVGRTLVLFSLPVLGSNILQSINCSANAIWVSHVLGEPALAAISNANQIFFLMLGAVFGITMAANILLAQSVGAKNRAMAKKVAGSCAVFFAVISVVVGLLGYAFTPAILSAMGTPPDARGQAIAYLRVIFAAMPSIYFFAYLMMAQRATGDSRTPFYFSLMAVGLDVVLNPLLIIGVGPLPRLGIAGSSTATLISQTLTLVVMVTHLYRRDSVLVLRRGEWNLLVPDLAILRSLVLKGLPMGFQMIVISLSAVTMMSLVNAYGSHTAAAYGAAAQLWTYVQMPAMAIGAAVSSMAAQNVGAGKMDRLAETAWKGALIALLFTATPVLAIYFTNAWVLHAFLPAASPALPIAQHINSITLWSFLFFGVAFVFNGVMRATGAVWAPIMAMLIALWGVRLPFALAVQPYWGADAVWFSFPLGSFVMVCLAGAYYQWGGWRKARMLAAPIPHGEVPDTGLGPPGGVEETEVAAAAAKKDR